MIKFIKKYCMTKHRTALLLTIIVLIFTGCDVSNSRTEKVVDKCGVENGKAVALARYKYRKEIAERFDKCVAEVSKNPASDRKLSAAVEQCKESSLEIYGADSAGWVGLDVPRAEQMLRECGLIED